MRSSLGTVIIGSALVVFACGDDEKRPPGATGGTATGGMPGNAGNQATVGDGAAGGDTAMGGDPGTGGLAGEAPSAGSGGAPNGGADNGGSEVSAAVTREDGGTITLDDTTVVVPPDAVAETTTITLREVDATSLAALPQGFTAVGPAVALLPHGLTFSAAVSITLPHSAGSSSDLQVVRLDDEEDESWAEVPGTVFDTSSATFQTTTFSVVQTASSSDVGAGGAGGVSPEADTPIAGQVIITEVMAAPTVRTAAQGGYFEVKNVSAKPLDLLECRFNSLVLFGQTKVTSSVVLAPGAIAVVSGGDDPGFVATYKHTPFTVNAPKSALELQCPDGSGGYAVVDHAEWDIDAGTFDTSLGVSLSMDPANLTATMNDEPELWAASTTVYATSQDGTKRDYGTPGLPNDPRVLPAAIADCGLLEEVVTMPVTQVARVSAWLDVPGWTNRTSSSNDAHPLIRGRAILGNGSDDPATWSVGYGATPRAPWQAPSASADAYRGELPASGLGIFAFGFQFSSDGGRLWRSCDTNGDGFDLGFAGKLKSVNPFAYISEYLQDGTKQALEFHNPRNNVANIGSCKVEIYPDGSSPPVEVQLPLIDIAAGGEYVVCNSNHTIACDYSIAELVFDGNDAVVLKCDGQVVDALGQIGNANKWGEAVDLRRMCLPGGDPVATDGFYRAQEWTIDETPPIDRGDLGNVVCIE